MDIKKINQQVKEIKSRLYVAINNMIYSCDNHEFDCTEYTTSVAIAEGYDEAMTADRFYAGTNNVRVAFSDNENNDDVDLKYLDIETLINIYEYLKCFI